MKFWKISLAACALTALATLALAASGSTTGSQANQSIWLSHGAGIMNWRAIGRDELIIWASPSKPYLVTIWPPIHEPAFHSDNRCSEHDRPCHQVR